jgi:glycerophosphoryl diester phosphodiesterase
LKRQIVAHRGFTRLYPENTRASVAAALKLGAKFVEIDVQLSADHVPVVYHDAFLKRVSGLKGDLRKLPWSKLKGLPASEPARLGKKFKNERISSLAQLARRFAGVKGARGARLFVELKEESLKPFGRLEMLSAVHAALGALRPRCILISFDADVLLLARALTNYPLGYVVRRFSDLRSPLMRRLKPEFVFSGTRMLPQRGSLKVKGAKHCVYEVPDPAQGRALLKRGADLIETFALDAYLGGK